MAVNKLTLPAKENAVQNKINEIIDNLGGGGGGTTTDVQINGTSITSNSVANIVTNTDYNASSNKIATMSDLSVFVATYGTTSYQDIVDAYNDGKIVYCISSITNNTPTILTYVDTNNGIVYFDNSIYGSFTCESSDLWSSRSAILQTTLNKVNSISSGSTNTQYPSARCVYDNLLLKENTSNKVTSLSSSSTDTQYPSAKCVYDELQKVKRNIGEIVTSTIPLTDTGLHLLDGSLISGSGSYADFVSYIASIYDVNANYFCSESDWQTSLTNYGVCGKFVYDSVNNTVRLPKITGFTEGTIDVTTLGDLTEAGIPPIPDHTHSVTACRNGVKYVDYDDGNGKHVGNTTFDTAGCSTTTGGVYGNSNTVQPQSIKVLYYIVVANSTKTEIEVDIDDIATDLNNKADKDFVNINQTAKNAIINTMMPDYTNGISYTYTTAHTDQTYTMPNDGVLYYTLSSYNLNTKPAYIKVNGYTVNYMGSPGKTTAQVTIGNINVNKNDIITVNSYYTDDFLTKITFFPMKGAA